MQRIIILLFCLLPFGAFAQTSTGTVFDYGKRTASLPGVNVRNLTNHHVTTTSKDGKYTIAAKVGDLLEFSLVGYHTDTLYLLNLQARKVYLPSKENTLNDVTVTGVKINSEIANYKDPNAEAYVPINTGGNLDRKDMNDKVGGVNLSLGYGRYKRQKQKEAALEEKDKYNQEIDYNFSQMVVGNLTKLEGQALKNFMVLYRPTVEAVKAQRPFPYNYYISKSFSAWKKLTPKQQKLEDLPNLNAN
ncbi:hypothetical protein [Pedobacter sp. MW01-1-1]|uniref:hypothetical protein n=1 Tax=Pedobacter sp. MW01-1-1 TaxID=3383027 RepID=UPI003FED7943